MKQAIRLVGAIALVLSALFSAAAVAQDAGIDNQNRNAYLASLKGKRVVFIAMTMQVDMTNAWAKMMQRQAKELGYTLDIRDANWSTEVGSRALTTAIAEKPDLIVLQNADVQAYARLIKQAADAKVKVLQLNMESLQKSDGYVGADWVGIGYAAGQELAQRCAVGKGRSTKVQVLLGAPTSAVDLFQLFGLRKALAQHPEIKIVSQQTTNYDANKARSITASVLQQHPDLCGSFGIWDAMDAGTGAAIKEAGQQGKVFVVTSGAGAETSCQKVKDGTFSALVSYDSRVHGAAINTMVVNMLRMPQSTVANPMVYYPPSRVITKDNLRPGSCWGVDDLL